jgi:hypothetical protein
MSFSAANPASDSDAESSGVPEISAMLLALADEVIE